MHFTFLSPLVVVQMLQMQSDWQDPACLQPIANTHHMNTETRAHESGSSVKQPQQYNLADKLFKYILVNIPNNCSTVYVHCDVEYTWRCVHGGVCMEACAWRRVHGDVCMEVCAWRCVHGDVCMEACAWRCVHGGVCMHSCEANIQLKFKSATVWGK